METWSDYLTKPTAISRRLGVHRSLIYVWKDNDFVPTERFIGLVDVLATLNIKLTIEQMGALNSAETPKQMRELNDASK